MPKGNSQVVLTRRREARRKVLLRRTKVGFFITAAIASLGIAAFLVIAPILAVRDRAPAAPAAAGEVRQVVMTMAGFDPQVLRVSAGRPFTVRLVNPDSPFHTDGGGWHQFSVERLGVDVRVPPRSERTQTFAGLLPGAYEFYCDVCCGGKESPAMRGVIEVVG